MNFFKEAMNIIFFGRPKVCKTHLAIALGIKPAQLRKRALFYNAEQLTLLLVAILVGRKFEQIT